MARCRPGSGWRGWSWRGRRRETTAATPVAAAPATTAAALAGLLVMMFRRLLPLARTDERATPRMLLPEIGGPRIERAEHAGTAPGALEPVGDIEVPGARAQLGRERVNAPAAARLGVEEPIGIDGVIRARLRAGDEQLCRPGARPGTRSATAPGIYRCCDNALRTLELRDR